MSFNAKDILEKAKKNAEEKTQKEKELLEAKLKAEEERKKKEAEEKLQREKEEAERLEQERIEAEQKRLAKEEADRKAKAEAERLEQERKAAEEEKQRELEIEKAKAQEEVRQKALAEKQKNTKSTENEMQILLQSMKNLLAKKAKIYEINNMIDKADKLVSRDVFYEQISCTEEFKKVLYELELRKKKYYDRSYKRYSFFQVLKKIGIIAACVLVLGLAVFGIVKCSSNHKSSIKNTKTKQITYKVGERGQGGVVFYDKGEYSDGWRYLEVSTKRLPERYWANPEQYNYISGLKGGLGEGDFNTENIIRVFGTDSAAYIATTYDAGGYDDWYLPTREEMSLAYKIAGKKYAKKIAKKVTGWKPICYSLMSSSQNCWTSEMAGKGKAYIIDCSSFLGGKDFEREIYTYELFGKDYFQTNYIRPVRKF